MSETVMCPIYHLYPWLAGHFALTDGLIFLAYLIIPITLFPVIRKLPRALANELKVFGALMLAFILTCGITHFIKIGLLWNDWWMAALYANYFCAAASVIATIHLCFVALPKLIAGAEAMSEISAAEDLEAATIATSKFKVSLLKSKKK